jgi:hypothetical protein
MKTEEKRRAQQLRREGHSVKQIERRLGIARSTVSLWVREVELPDHQRAVIVRRGVKTGHVARSAYYRTKRRAAQEEGRQAARRRESLHVAGCMLFWGEGSKHRNMVQLANSDPAMVALFARFLRRYFEPPDDSLRLMCNLFADHEERQREIEDFWLATAGLSRSSLTKSTVNRYSCASKRTRINRLPYGTCRLTFYSTRAAQHIYGAIQEYGGFERPEWLD